MGKWTTSIEVFAATFAVVTLWSCALTMLLMTAIPGVFGASFMAPLIATYGPGIVAAIKVSKKVHES